MSITLPPLQVVAYGIAGDTGSTTPLSQVLIARPSTEHYAHYIPLVRAYDAAAAMIAAVGAYEASQPQTMPSELRAAAAAVVARWDTPVWKNAEHTGTFIARLRAALEAVEAPPVAQAQPESAPAMPKLGWPSLHRFMDAAAGEGLVFDDIDACDLCIELFPALYGIGSAT